MPAIGWVCSPGMSASALSLAAIAPTSNSETRGASSVIFLLNLKSTAPYTKRSCVVMGLRWVMFVFPLLPIPFPKEGRSMDYFSSHDLWEQRILPEYFIRRGEWKGKEVKKIKGSDTSSSMTPLQNQYYPNKIMSCLYIFFPQQGLRVHLFVLHCLLGTV